MIVADAITRAGVTDGPRLRESLAQTKNFPGVTGATTIDAQRNASKSAVIIAVQDGHFKFVDTIAP
jgi:branched-chain amino acid transport system substrate-binding protein